MSTEIKVKRLFYVKLVTFLCFVNFLLRITEHEGGRRYNLAHSPSERLFKCKLVNTHIACYYMALACGRYNARSDWLRERSERSLCNRNAHGLITDYAN